MGRRRKEERDLRSLDRTRMDSIFAPLDPEEPAAGGATGFQGRNSWTSPFAPRLDDPWWKTALTWLWLPAVVLFLTVELWLPLPQLIGWLLFLVFIGGYCVLGWFAYRKPSR